MTAAKYDTKRANNHNDHLSTTTAIIAALEWSAWPAASSTPSMSRQVKFWCTSTLGGTNRISNQCWDRSGSGEPSHCATSVSFVISS